MNERASALAPPLFALKKRGLGGVLFGLGGVLCLLLLTGCAYENNPDTGGVGRNDLIEVRMIFNDRVNPERFFYYLVFNFDEDPTRIPLVDIDVFQDRGVIGQWWDVYYLYGRPGEVIGPQLVNFYKGFGGNDVGQTGFPLRVDNTGTRFIDILPQRPFDSTALEFVTATVTNGSTNPNDPLGNVLTANTLLFQFRATEFPNAPYELLRNGRAKITMFVANQGIDIISNPDDDFDDALIYDRFLETAVFIDLTQKPEWNEQTDPQEVIEEERLPRNPQELNGPFAAADLVNWSVKLIRQ